MEGQRDKMNKLPGEPKWKLLFTRRNVGRASLLLFAAVFICWFGVASYRAWVLQTADGFSCAKQYHDLRSAFSYVQFTLKDQHQNEPYFNGEMFLNLGDHSEGPFKVASLISSRRGFGDQSINVDLNYRDKTLWMQKAVDVSFYRIPGSPRDFPFDSTRFDFTAKFDPPLDIGAVFIRNSNPSFYVPCDTFQTQQLGAGVYEVSFSARRNPLVKITAVILLCGGFLFLLGITVYVKRDGLPTAVASYFFSLWSIRSILSSEIRSFPTELDLVILSFCVVLVIGVALRLGFGNSEEQT